MRVRLTTSVEDAPGLAWAARWHAFWPGYRAWFLSEGEHARPTATTTVAELRRHMPELLPLYDDLVWRAGGSDHAARCLGLYRPAHILAGCSQAVWTRDEAVLVRNYDYNVSVWEQSFVSTGWLGRRVIGMSDCLWGLLDGMNDAGLALSLAFGGRRVVGDGFGISLIMRYVLQTCDTTAQAVAVLRRVPCHMAYNITALDHAGSVATVFIGPDRAPTVSVRRVITNHQGIVEWPEHAEATGSVARLRTLTNHLDRDTETAERFVHRFLEPPTYSRKHRQGFGTLYTAAYWPRRGTAALLWPGRRLDMSLHSVVPGVAVVDLSEA